MFISFILSIFVRNIKDTREKEKNPIIHLESIKKDINLWLSFLSAWLIKGALVNC